MDPISLKADVTVRELFKNESAENIKKIEAKAVDGFTETELQELKDDGIDIDLIKENAEATKAYEKQGTKSDNDVKDKIEELKAKYAAEAGGGDPYSMDNPQLKAFQEAVNDGVFKDLSAEGFTKTQIVDVVAGVFPSIGISSTNNGGYTCPQGHPVGSEATEVYNKFISQLLSAVGEDTQEIKDKRAEITEIGNKILNNNRALRSLEASITIIQAEIEESINDAIEKSKEIAEEQKEQSKNAVAECLSAYTASDGEMTYEEFQKNLAGKLDTISGEGDSKLAKVVCAMVDAERKMTTLTGYMGKMKDLIDSNKELSEQLSKSKEDLAALLKKQEETASCCEDECCQRIDPIGFTEGDVRYDFFIDKDDNADLSNENEFLGSENGYSELKELDKDGSGIVEYSELKNAGVKVVQTNADGTQEIKDISDVLKEGDSIDLNSYKALHADIGENNILEGTFNVNKDGKDLEGYQTLDSLDWLDSNYNFTDRVEGKGRFAQDEDGNNIEALDYSDKYNEFNTKTEELRGKLDGLYEEYNLTAEVKESIQKMATAEGNFFASSIKDKFEKKAAEEAKAEEDAAKAEEEKEAEKAAKAEEEKAAEKAEEAAKAEAADAEAKFDEEELKEEEK